MTVTDQVVSTADCRPCGHARFSHRQGVGGCKLCTCEGYEPDTAASAKPELDRLQAQVEQLERAVTVITADRDEARREANEAANKNARLRVERDAARAEVAELVEDRTHLAVEVANLRRVNDELAKVRRQLADAEAALVEANGRHLHQRISAAALVIGQLRDWRFCPLCWHLRRADDANDADHRCGPLAPVDVKIARRPNPPTTEEQP